MARKILLSFGVVLLLFSVSIGLAYWSLMNFAETPADIASKKEVIFRVEKGTPPSILARRLEENGLVKSAKLLSYLIRLERLGRKIKSGEYELSPSMTPRQILDKLVKGGVVTYKVTIPEGLRVTEIARRLETLGLVRYQEFVQEALSGDAPKRYGIKGAPSLEGYLYPDTYRFAKGLPVNSIIKAMVNRFKKEWKPEYDKRARELGMTMNQVVTLASIIEKETGSPEERPMISAVFHSRLKKGWKLQSDPTVIYGIEDFDGNIKKKDLTTDHPYNTYTRKGLPPGPIASPGGDAIKAALYPAKVPYMFFVSRNDGTHVFSVTLAEHEAAVEKWQRLYFRKKGGKSKAHGER